MTLPAEPMATAVPAPIKERRPPFRLLKSQILRGANVYHASTVLRQQVDLGDLAGLCTGAAGPEFAPRFVDRFGELIDFRTAKIDPKNFDAAKTDGGQANGANVYSPSRPLPNRRITKEFLERLHSTAGVPIEEALFEAILTIELSATLAMFRLDTLRYAEMLRGEDRQTVDLIWESRLPMMSRASARAGFIGLVELLPRGLRPRRSRSMKTYATWLDILDSRATRRQWSTTAAGLALAAKERGLPCECLGDAYLLIGQGVAQQVIYASIADKAVPPPKPDGTSNEGGVVSVSSAASDYALPIFADPPGVCSALLELTFPPGTSGRIPIALIAGRRGTTLVARELDIMLRTTGKAVGLATRKGVTISGQPVDQGSVGRSDGARLLLHDPRVEVLVTATSPRRIVQRGLRLDACTAAAIVDAEPGAATEMAGLALDVIGKATSGALVVSVESPFAIAALRALGTSRVILLSEQPSALSVRRHQAAGGLVALHLSQADGETIELHRGSEVVASVPTFPADSRNQSERRRRARARVFAVALAFGLGFSGREIEAAAKRRIYLHR